MTTEEIAQRRELVRIKHALKKSAVEIEDSETKVHGADVKINVEENNSEIVVKTTQNEDDIMFIAFGRIYSGTIRRGQDIYVLGPKHDPSKITDKVSLVRFYVSQKLVIMLCSEF